MKRSFSFQNNEPILYLLATPIGNLKEFSPRAIEILGDADLIACEDTRNTAKLLSFFNIKKTLISVHEHNEKKESSHLIDAIKNGKKVCYVSDAGYPGISDPGSLLVKECLENDINVSSVSGSCAFINALICSGLETNHFYFHGFLDARMSKMKTELEDLKGKKETLIFYESPHRISKTLKILYEVLGDRKISIARELTKAYEEYIRGTLKELSELDESTLIGEMVLIVEGNKNTTMSLNEDDIIEILKKTRSKELDGRNLVENVATTYKLNKKLVYSLYLKEIKK